MRSFLLLFLFILASNTGCQALISLGYSYKNVLFWRFWEMKDGQLVPELLVYNTGDSAISFAVRKTYVEGGCKPGKTTKEQYEKMDGQYGADTIVATTKIPAHQYHIFLTPGMQYGEGYNGAFVNGRGAGIAGAMQEPDKSITNRYVYKYYSYEAQYATHGYGLVCTDQIFTERGETGEMTIFFDFTDLQKWQFFTGINDIEGKISEGLDNVTIKSAGLSVQLSAAQNIYMFQVNISKGKTYRLDVFYKVAQNAQFPDLEMRYFFQNGNAGIDLPVFIP